MMFLCKILYKHLLNMDNTCNGKVDPGCTAGKKRATSQSFTIAANTKIGQREITYMCIKITFFLFPILPRLCTYFVFQTLCIQFLNSIHNSDHNIKIGGIERDQRHAYFFLISSLVYTLVFSSTKTDVNAKIRQRDYIRCLCILGNGAIHHVILSAYPLPSQIQ